MRTIRTAVHGGGGNGTAVLDMQESRGSGDLLISSGGTYAASMPELATCQLEQGPTVSGPWVSVPLVGTVDCATSDAISAVGQYLLTFSWSQRFLRVSFSTTDDTQFVLAQVLTPPGSVLR